MLIVNYAIDLYGLFRDPKGRSISIYSDERTAKYLLAHRYVPENFEGYILGPSLSANLNPKSISEHKIYNLSMMGANITEQKAVVEKALDRESPKFVLLCLHPYLTLDHGMKTGMINPREYYGALGSFSLYKAYGLRIIRALNLMPSKFPKDQFNDYGCNHYDDLLRTKPVEDKVAEEVANPDAVKTTIDPEAWGEFNELVDELRARNVTIVAYFHPLPRPVYDRFKDRLDSYRDRLTQALTGKAVILNYNDDAHQFFTSNLGNYIDHGHLSEQGQAYLLRQILTDAHLLQHP